MKAGTSVDAEYDIPVDAWYFDADRQDQVPYAVLLEVALQACGWVSAYMGSALTSLEPLKYRNLGGTATQHEAVDRWSGTLAIAVKVTKVNQSAGMIIQNFEFSVHNQDTLILDGDTYFGFFHPDALAEQVGIREAAPYVMNEAERTMAQSFPVPDQRPFPDARWRMVEQIDAFVPEGGPHGLGVIEGSTPVNRDAWFFKAHFLDDPVWPGSLGLESVLQLLKVVAADRWGSRPKPPLTLPVWAWPTAGSIAARSCSRTTRSGPRPSSPPATTSVGGCGRTVLSGSTARSFIK